MKFNFRRAAPLFAPLAAAFFLGSCVKRETAVAAGLRTQTLHVTLGSDPEGLDRMALK